MDIELYLRFINQEFPDSHRTSQIKNLDNDNVFEERWPYDWNVWPYDWANWPDDWPYRHGYYPESTNNIDSDRFLIREEFFGALLYDQQSSAVFKLDKDGYDFIRRILTGKSVTEACADGNYPEEEVDRFIKNMEFYKLW